MSRRAAITAVFFVDGALFATWASRIPALSDRVHAGAGILGLCLLAPAAAAVVSMPLVGRLLPGRSSSPSYNPCTKLLFPGCKALNTHPKPLSRSILVNFIARSVDIRAKTIGCRRVAP